MNGIIILGAAGLAKEFFLYIKRANPEIKEFYFVNDLDDDQNYLEIEGENYPVVKNWIFEKKYDFVVAVGSPKIKKKLVKKAIDSGLKPAKTIIDPSALILIDRSNIGFGGVIAPGCILTTNIKIGNFVTLNLNTTVGHDTIIGDYCTTNPGVHISGQLSIGECNEFGTGCIVRDRLTLGSNKTFGAQTAVVKNIIGDESEIYIGVPSKKLEK
jgi:sugar O-acyltransferase (sialic acid O-acetyltransferase NeuD family)